MNRRELLKLLGMAAASLAIPLEFPVRKEIVIEAARIGLVDQDVIANELQRIMPMLVNLFEREMMFSFKQ